jgi:His-Xaa-Ser system protein HxsD
MKAEFLGAEGKTLVTRVQLGVYGLEPLLKAAHRFTDRCFVHLEYEDAANVLCRFRVKRPLDNIEQIAGDFVNELLDQSLRARLAASTEPVRQLLIAQAFSKTSLFHPELDSADPFTDPASIGNPDDPHH